MKEDWVYVKSRGEINLLTPAGEEKFCNVKLLPSGKSFCFKSGIGEQRLNLCLGDIRGSMERYGGKLGKVRQGMWIKDSLLQGIKG